MYDDISYVFMNKDSPWTLSDVYQQVRDLFVGLCIV